MQKTVETAGPCRTAFQDHVMKILTISPKLQPHWTYHACSFHKCLLTVPFLCSKCLQVKRLISMLCFSFLINCPSTSQCAPTILRSHQQHMTLLLHILASIWYCHHFYFSSANRCILIPNRVLKCIS